MTAELVDDARIESIGDGWVRLVESDEAVRVGTPRARTTDAIWRRGG